MLLTEFTSKVDQQKELHDEQEDQSVKSIDNLRSNKLTLEHLNKIRRSKDIRRYEMEQKQKLVQQQYGQAADTDSI